jgi:hypothetical protein
MRFLSGIFLLMSIKNLADGVEFIVCQGRALSDFLHEYFYY